MLIKNQTASCVDVGHIKWRSDTNKTFDNEGLRISCWHQHMGECNQLDCM